MRALKLIIEILFWTVLAGALIFAVGVVIGLLLAPLLGYVAAIGVLILLPLGVGLMRGIRRRRAVMTLSYLEQAVRLNLPLPQMMLAAQQSERGKTSLRLADLRLFLSEGMPLGAALFQAVPEVSDRDSSLVEASERIGRIPRTLRRIVDDHAHEARRRSEADSIFIRAYPLMMLMMMGLIVSVLIIFVIPKYEQIFKDFGARLPPITQTMLAVARVIGQPLLVIVTIAVLLTCGIELWQIVRPVRWSSSIVRRTRDYVRFAIPFVHGIDRDRGLADACHFVADALAAGVPVDAALRDASTIDMNFVLSSRLHHWSTRISAGSSLSDSARSARMPALVSGMLATIHGPEAPDVFRFLARYYRTRFSRTAALLRGATVPAIVFLFALLVGCIAMAMFLPMINLIDSLSTHALRP
jgi:type II secretory pathway component PulF